MPAADPYHRWLGIPPKDQPPHHYRLLGIDLFETDADVIAMAADQRMIHLRTFQAGPERDACQRLLNEVAAARVVLLNPRSKGGYDAHLRNQLGLRHPQQTPSFPEPANTLDALESAVAATAAETDFTSEPPRRSESRKRRPASTSQGMRVYTFGLLGVGIVGLAIMLWVRANHWQIQLVQGDTGPAAGKSGSTTEAPKSPASGQRATATPSPPPRVVGPSSTAGAEQFNLVPPANPDGPVVRPGQTPPSQAVARPPAQQSPSGVSQAGGAPEVATPTQAGKPPVNLMNPQGRLRWEHSQGNFQQVSNSKWIETTGGVTRQYRTEMRTNNFIELGPLQFGPGFPDAVWARLEATRALYHKQGQPWQAQYQGGWAPMQEEPPSQAISGVVLPPSNMPPAASGNNPFSNDQVPRAEANQSPSSSATEWEADRGNFARATSFPRIKLQPSLFLDQSMVDISQNAIGQMVPEGADVFQRMSGAQMTGAFSSVRGKLEGPAVELYLANQMELFGRYDDGKRHGDFRLWDGHGKRLLFSQYKKGAKNGITCVFRGGSPRYVEIVSVKGDVQEFLVRIPPAGEPAVIARQDFSADDSQEILLAKSRLATLETQLLEHERAYKSEFLEWWENVKRQRANAMASMKRANISARNKAIDAQNAAVFNNIQRAATMGR